MLARAWGGESGSVAGVAVTLSAAFCVDGLSVKKMFLRDIRRAKQFGLERCADSFGEDFLDLVLELGCQSLEAFA